MSTFSKISKRAILSIKKLSQTLTKQSKPNILIPKTNATTAIKDDTHDLSSNPVTNNNNGNDNNENDFNPTSKYLPKDKFKKVNDHNALCEILGRKDWYLLLDHELKAGRLCLNPENVVSILQNHENPIHSVRFYMWVLNFNQLYEKNQKIKGVLGNVLYRKGPVLLSSELVEDINRAGFRITEDLMCVLINSWGRLGLAKYCVEIFGQISYLRLNASTRLYNAVIDALIKTNSLNLAYLKYQEMDSDRCKPDRFTYNILIHGVCKSGVVDEAIRLMKLMEKAGYVPNVFTYTILIDGYCNAKRVDDAFRVLETMRVKKVSPSDATYRSLVHGVFRSMDSRKGFELLSKFVESKSVLPKVACDTMLYCLSNNSMAVEVALFLRSCRKRGYVPDNSLFNITVTCLISKLDVETTCEIVDSFVQLGLSLSLETYLSLIETLFRRAYAKEGNRYLTEMLEAGLVKTVISYNMVIDCLLKFKNTHKALDLFEAMQKRGFSPNLSTFNTLIDGHFKAAETERARELFAKLLQHGLRPNIITFTSLIDGLCRANKIEEALDCIAEMKEWGVNPNSVTYNILIRYLSVMGDVGKCKELFRKMQTDGISPDTNSFNAMMRNLCKRKKIEKAQNLYVSMLALGLAPDVITNGILIKSLCDSGKFQEAKDAFFSMEANGRHPDIRTCNVFVDMLLKSGQVKEAQDIASKYKTRDSRVVVVKSDPLI